MKLITSLLIIVAVILSVSLSSPATAGIIPIANAGFEDDVVYTGFPPAPGTWGYDVCEVVGAEQGITPFEGSSMVRFIAAYRSGASCPEHGSSLFQVYRVIGSHIEDDVATGTLRIIAEYNCNRVHFDSETDTRFYIEVLAYDGPDYPSDWNDGATWLLKESAYTDTDADPATWELVSLVTSELPAETAWLGIHIYADENIHDDCDEPEFDGHYADNVRVYFGSTGTENSTWGGIKAQFGK